jgi:hypothetical protein
LPLPVIPTINVFAGERVKSDTAGPAQKGAVGIAHWPAKLGFYRVEIPAHAPGFGSALPPGIPGGEDGLDIRGHQTRAEPAEQGKDVHDFSAGHINERPGALTLTIFWWSEFLV